MKRILFSVLFAASLSAEAQTPPMDIDTVGKVLPYADFRIRPY